MISIARTILKQKAPGLYSVARFLRLQGEKALFKEYVASHCFGGHELSVVISDRVAKEWYDHDLEKPSSFGFLSERRLSDGATVFVLGAHQAVVSMMLARDVGDGGSIIAVEGNSENYAIGTRNLQLNKMENVKLLHAVVGAAEGELAFSSAHNGMVEANASLSAPRVPSVSVDSLAGRFGVPDIVMLDIEGYEGHALEGASRTLQSRCVWYIEVHGNEQLGRYGKSNADVINHFVRDFELFFSPDDLLPFGPVSNFGNIPEGRFFVIAVPK